MYARTISAQTSPERLDEAIQRWRESAAPSHNQLKGFKKTYLLVERSTGKIKIVALFETEADLKASVEWHKAQTAKFAGFFPTPPSVENYEVAAEV